MSNYICISDVEWISHYIPNPHLIYLPISNFPPLPLDLVKREEIKKWLLKNIEGLVVTTYIPIVLRELVPSISMIYNYKQDIVCYRYWFSLQADAVLFKLTWL